MLNYIKIHILFLMLFLPFAGKTQAYFNNRYDNFNNGDLSTAIDTFNNQYLTLGVGINTAMYGFSWGLNLKMYNVNTGSETNTKTYFINGVNFAPQTNKPIRLNEQVLVCGEKVYSGYNSWVFAWKFNSNLDSVNYKQYGYPNKTNSCWATVRTADQKIYYTGYTDSANTNSDILIIKTDTAGNEIWKKKIGIVGWDELAFSIKTLSNNRLVISGSKRIHGGSYGGDYILGLDTSGGLLWQNFFPSSNYASGSLDVLELPNGNIAFTGDDAFTNSPQGVLRKPVLGLLDSGGNLIWRKSYGDKYPGHDFYKLLLNSRNNFVACGTIGYSNNSVNGIVYEINQNGDSLFSKEYAIQPGSQNYFRDFIEAPAPDRGYCFGGYTAPIVANGGTGSQDIWLLKVDSNFCESNVSCGYPTGFAPLTADEGVRVFPNPSNGQITFIFGTDTSTGSVTKQENCTIEMYNANGQLVKNKSVNIDDERVTIEMQDLKDGIYFYRIYNNDKQLKANKIVLIK